MSAILPLDGIKSTRRYVVFAPWKGVLSEHDRVSEALHRVVEYCQENPGVRPMIYRRGSNGWHRA